MARRLKFLRQPGALLTVFAWLLLLCALALVLSVRGHAQNGGGVAAAQPVRARVQ